MQTPPPPEDKTESAGTAQARKRPETPPPPSKSGSSTRSALCGAGGIMLTVALLMFVSSLGANSSDGFFLFAWSLILGAAGAVTAGIGLCCTTGGRDAGTPVREVPQAPGQRPVPQASPGRPANSASSFVQYVGMLLLFAGSIVFIVLIGITKGALLTELLLPVGAAVLAAVLIVRGVWRWLKKLAAPAETRPGACPPQASGERMPVALIAVFVLIFAAICGLGWFIIRSASL